MLEWKVNRNGADQELKSFNSGESLDIKVKLKSKPCPEYKGQKILYWEGLIRIYSNYTCQTRYGTVDGKSLKDIKESSLLRARDMGWRFL